MTAPDKPIRSLTRSEKLGYGAGEVGANLAWNFVAAFLLFYYSDVALLPIGALGTLVLVTRVFDAVTDPLVGLLVDRTLSKRGKTRLYLFCFPIPFALLCVLTFSVPDIAPNLKVVYAYVTFLLLGLAYTLLYVPYGALLPMMTQDYAEKAQLSSYRMMGTSIGSIVVYGTALLIVSAVGNGNDQLGFTSAAVVFGFVSAGLFYVVYYCCPERFCNSNRPTASSAGTQFKRMLQNRTWRIAMFFGITNFIRLGVIVSGVAYFAKNVLGSTELVGILLPVLSVATLVFGFLSGPLLSRISIRSGVLGACIAYVILYAFLPMLEDRHGLFFSVFSIASGTGAIIGTATFMIMTTSVECHEKLYGEQSHGVLVSGLSFSFKAGLALGTAIVAYTLGFVGYDPQAVSEEARATIRGLFYIAPPAIAIVQALASLTWFEDLGRSVPAAVQTEV